MTAARGSNTSPEFGSVKPTASKSLKSPFASRSPRKRPTIDATTPTTSASTMTEPRTWRFVAPIVRSVANSRVRCAIVIESEFAMTNEPTKSAIPPNASRNPRRNEMKSFVSAASSAACSLPVLHLRGRRQDPLDLATSWASGTSGFAATAISSSWPTFLNSRCAVGRSKPASVAPPIVRPELNWTMPETFRCWTGPSACTPIVSPTAKSSFDAVSLSITTSSVFGHDALEQRERVEHRVAVRDREAEVRRAAEDDRLPVVADELRRVRVDAALRLRDAGKRADLREQRLVERRCGDPVLIPEVEGRLARR